MLATEAFVSVLTSRGFPARELINQTGNTGGRFSKVCFNAPSLSQKIYIICFVNQKKSEDYFCFYKKKKAKILKWSFCCFVDFVFCSKPLKRQLEHGLSGATKRLPEELHSASSRHSFELYLWTSVLYLDMFCASLIKMNLKVFSSPFYAILVYERLSRNGLLLGGRRKLYAQSIKPIPDWLG